MAGQVVRADVHMTPDGRSRGSGIVAFDNPDDAQNAIQLFNGYDWQGRQIEVREDRYAGSGPGPPQYGGRGGFGYGGRGGYGGGYGGRGGFDGGYGGRGGGYGGGYGGRGGYGGGYGGRGGYGGGRGGGYGGGGDGGYGHNAPAQQVVAPNAFTDYATSGTEPGPVIYVRNVSLIPIRKLAFLLTYIQLPWSTSNDDLIELFTTIGKVERAEIQYEPTGRSRGTGVVEFSKQDDSAEAISKFQGYQYGGRPLGIAYVRYTNQGGDMMEAEPTGSMQEQMM